ncbi:MULTISPECIES: hypothetical protein [Marinobacter]|uniref:hypothetical protein n=1 Tax=Marinobacter TaxID=2742 RepID=UPI001248C91E|nr:MULTISPECIES: hypothetical protein [Marinobacter]MBL3559156.1 hypothetical protein [Marinobacter sp. JB05H06]
MSDLFETKLGEAKGYISRGEPFWCEDFSRPKDQEFAEYLRKNGLDISYLYCMESWEGVYFPRNFNYQELQEISRKRAELREAGVSESDLPSSL